MIAAVVGGGGAIATAAAIAPYAPTNARPSHAFSAAASGSSEPAGSSILGALYGADRASTASTLRSNANGRAIPKDLFVSDVGNNAVEILRSTTFANVESAGGGRPPAG